MTGLPGGVLHLPCSECGRRTPVRGPGAAFSIWAVTICRACADSPHEDERLPRDDEETPPWEC